MNKALKALTVCMAIFICASALFACGGGTDKDKKYIFYAKQTEMKIGDSADIVELLGTPMDVKESESCGGIAGTDRNYLFSGFRVYTTPSQSGDVVCKIELVDDSIKTPEGLKIGDSRDAVISTLGSPNAASDIALTYNGKGMTLKFILREGIVTNIQYASV